MRSCHFSSSTTFMCVIFNLTCLVDQLLWACVQNTYCAACYIDLIILSRSWIHKPSTIITITIFLDFFLVPSCSKLCFAFSFLSFVICTCTLITVFINLFSIVFMLELSLTFYCCLCLSYLRLCFFNQHFRILLQLLLHLTKYLSMFLLCYWHSLFNVKIVVI